MKIHIICSVLIVTGISTNMLHGMLQSAITRDEEVVVQETNNNQSIDLSIDLNLLLRQTPALVARACVLTIATRPLAAPVNTFLDNFIIDPIRTRHASLITKAVCNIPINNTAAAALTHAQLIPVHPPAPTFQHSFAQMAISFMATHATHYAINKLLDRIIYFYVHEKDITIALQTGDFEFNAPYLSVSLLPWHPSSDNNTQGIYKTYMLTQCNRMNQNANNNKDNMLHCTVFQNRSEIIVVEGCPIKYTSYKNDRNRSMEITANATYESAETRRLYSHPLRRLAQFQTAIRALHTQVLANHKTLIGLPLDQIIPSLNPHHLHL